MFNTASAGLRTLKGREPDVQEVSMKGRSGLDKRRLAQETEREAERGRKHKVEAHHEGRRDGDHRTL